MYAGESPNEVRSTVDGEAKAKAKAKARQITHVRLPADVVRRSLQTETKRVSAYAKHARDGECMKHVGQGVWLSLHQQNLGGL